MCSVFRRDSHPVACQLSMPVQSIARISRLPACCESLSQFPPWLVQTRLPTNPKRTGLLFVDLPVFHMVVLELSSSMLKGPHLVANRACLANCRRCSWRWGACLLTLSGRAWTSRQRTWEPYRHAPAHLLCVSMLLKQGKSITWCCSLLQ